jgi:hypothetical protein
MLHQFQLSCFFEKRHEKANSVERVCINSQDHIFRPHFYPHFIELDRDSTRDMSVFVWGSNKYQQLIGQSGLHCYSPALVANAFEDQTPIQVAAGDQHILVLSETGDVFAFGCGQDGQLGNGKRWSGKQINDKVIGLEHETIIHVSAGSHCSFAVTSTGSVYHWGMVHVEELIVDKEEEVNANAQAGQLTGLARNQDLAIQPEQESRRTRAEAAARSGSRRHINENEQDGRYLRDIVRESTERWMLSSEDVDQEYYEELRLMGYHIDEVEERMQDRGREYHGMLRMVCRRQVQCLPLRIHSLDRVRIATISAGYAHVLALSDDGRLYASGYNDRGQLGLG